MAISTCYRCGEPEEEHTLMLMSNDKAGWRGEAPLVENICPNQIAEVTTFRRLRTWHKFAFLKGRWQKMQGYT